MQFKRKFLVGCFDLCYQYSFTAPICLQQNAASRRIFTFPKPCDQLFSKRYNSKMVEKLSKSKPKKKHLRRKVVKTEGPFLVDKEEAYRFMTCCLEKAGASKRDALETAAVLAEADYRGHSCHGISTLEQYVNDLQNKRCSGHATPEILTETCCTAWVDGHNGLGGPIGNFCMKLAIDKAQECGVGWVVAKGSNNYGMSGWYAMMAQEEGLLGLCFTNSSPIMSPLRGKRDNQLQPAVVTNPVAIAMPGSSQDDNFILDLPSKVLDLCKIQMKKKSDGLIPKESEQDPNSIKTTDAETPQLSGRSAPLWPLESSEKKTEHKGYGFGVLVEILSGVLSGSDYSTNIRKLDPQGKNPANLGHCFIAVDPARFAPGFKERMSDLMEQVKHTDTNDQEKSVLVEGDPERLHMQKVDEEGGIKYDKKQIEAVRTLAAKLDVEEMQVKRN